MNSLRATGARPKKGVLRGRRSCADGGGSGWVEVVMAFLPVTFVDHGRDLDSVGERSCEGMLTIRCKLYQAGGIQAVTGIPALGTSEPSPTFHFSLALHRLE